jgi:hypothetical protein
MSSQNTTIQLISFDEEDQMKINDDALAILKSIKTTLAILVIVGPMRQGKSYILSQTSKKLKSGNFTIGHDMDGCTKGLWINKTPIGLENGSSLILVDCQVIALIYVLGMFQKHQKIFSYIYSFQKYTIFNNLEAIQ